MKEDKRYDVWMKERGQEVVLSVNKLSVSVAPLAPITTTITPRDSQCPDVITVWDNLKMGCYREPLSRVSPAVRKINPVLTSNCTLITRKVL